MKPEEESYYAEGGEDEYYDEEEDEALAEPETQKIQKKLEPLKDRQEQVLKEFDPRKDKMLNITAEDILLDKSMKNFMPPELAVPDHSFLSFESYLPISSRHGIIAGVRLENLVQSEDSIEDLRYFTPFVNTVTAGQIEADAKKKQAIVES